jgi:hypothetical protein
MKEEQQMSCRVCCVRLAYKFMPVALGGARGKDNEGMLRDVCAGSLKERQLIGMAHNTELKQGQGSVVQCIDFAKVHCDMNVNMR